MIVHDFTKKEIDYLLEECNFTEQEKELFLLRSRDFTLQDCSAKMDFPMCTIKKLSQRVNKKIIKAI